LVTINLVNNASSQTFRENGQDTPGLTILLSEEETMGFAITAPITVPMLRKLEMAFFTVCITMEPLR
jgi:hypothetical protein